jgi:N-formylmaleamate deformylase
MTAWPEGDISANGTRIHYHRTGGAKPPVLLLHGITDNGLCWTRVALGLEGRYDLIMPDAPGHGASDGIASGFSFSILAETATAVIVGLGLQKPVVWGHSMGAIAAAVVAAHHPELVRAVIIEDPPLRDPVTPMRLPPHEMLHKTVHGARVYAESLLGRFPPCGEALYRRRMARFAVERPDWHPLELEQMVRAQAQTNPWILNHAEYDEAYPWRDAFKCIQCPGLMIAGDQANWATVLPEAATEAMELWKNLEVVRIAGAGHSAHRERYDETMAAVGEFLERYAG